MKGNRHTNMTSTKRVHFVKNTCKTTQTQLSSLWYLKHLTFWLTSIKQRSASLTLNQHNTQCSSLDVYITSQAYVLDEYCHFQVRTLPRRYYKSRYHFTYEHNYSTENCLHFTTWPFYTMHKMLIDQNAGRSHNIKIDNSSFGNVEEFKYLGTTLTNQNSIQEEIKTWVKSRKPCYHSVQNLLSSSSLSKNIKIRYTEL